MIKNLGTRKNSDNMRKKQNKKKGPVWNRFRAKKKVTDDHRDEFDRRVEKAWDAYDKGKFKCKSKKEFLDELVEC